MFDKYYEESLTESQKQLFQKIYGAHLSVCETPASIGIAPNQLKSIKQGDNEQQLHVHFNNIWFHYQLNENGNPEWY